MHETDLNDLRSRLCKKFCPVGGTEDNGRHLLDNRARVQQMQRDT
jgi:hypothetical protein